MDADDAVLARVAELEATVQRLTAGQGAERPRTRRQLLGLAGATAATTAFVGAASVGRADAAGNPLLLEQSNSTAGNLPTTLSGGRFLATGNSTAEFGTGFGSGWTGPVTGWETANNPSDTVTRGGVFGLADGTGNGVVGVASGTKGAAVLGDSRVATEGLSPGLYGRSEHGPALQLRQHDPRTSGSWSAGSFVVDANGDLQYCTASGSPGNWRNLSTMFPVFDLLDVTYHIQAGGQLGGKSLVLSTIGVDPFSLVGPGQGTMVCDDTHRLWYYGSKGDWVQLDSDTPTFSSVTAHDGVTAGHVTVTATGAGKPTTGTWAAGTLVADGIGNLWFCTAAGTPGTWVNLVPSSTPTVVAPAAPTYHPVTPARIYDSRVNTPTGALVAGTNRTIDVHDAVAVSSSTVVGKDVVPAHATSVTANVTVVATTGSGFLAINPKGDTTVHAATVNWFGDGQILNNGVNLTLGGDRQLTILAGGSTGASAHVVIDVTGYLL